MNVVFLSPDFPPNYVNFCTRLHGMGATVLGLSDQHYGGLAPELRAALTEYYRVGDLNSYDEVLRALGYFTHRYGKIDRIDSLNEHWLALEARLRTDFNVEGFKEADLPRIKRKSEMKRLFQQAGVPVARGVIAHTADRVRDLVAEVGLPLVAKPDIGVGANRTFKISTADQLEAFLAHPPDDYLLEEYIDGAIQTCDGLADRGGNPAFLTSMQYSQGVMDVVNDDRDVYYYTRRDVPADVEQAGRSLLRIFGVRERFFHFEFFRTGEGRLVALEVNMRPPGGLNLDMFNYANEIDLYFEWANMLVNGRFDARYSWPYAACYVARKSNKRYLLSSGEVLARYGQRIVHHQPMAQVFRQAMGDYGYIVRSPDVEEVVAIAEHIQAKG